MKLFFGSVVAAAVWANMACSQAPPVRSGPGSGPDHAPVLSRLGNDSLSATGLTAGMPGPYLPNPDDPTRVDPVYPSLFVGE